jgi:hypothetical protein
MAWNPFQKVPFSTAAVASASATLELGAMSSAMPNANPFKALVDRWPHILVKYQWGRYYQHVWVADRHGVRIA